MLVVTLNMGCVARTVSELHELEDTGVDRLVEQDQLLDTALAVASEMAAWPPLALRVSKRVLQHNVECELPEALRFELASLAVGNRAINDRKESLAAFRERRRPVYTGT